MSMSKDFFPLRPDFTPAIYAYSDQQYAGQLKIGYTAGDVAKRVADQYPTPVPAAYRIESFWPNRPCVLAERVFKIMPYIRIYAKRDSKIPPESGSNVPWTM